MATGRLRELGEGWAVWALLGLVAWGLPGRPWRVAEPGLFPWSMAALWLGLLGLLLLLVVGILGHVGPRLAGMRLLVAWEAVPQVLWAGLLLALWPASWGAPGRAAWVLLFLAALLPGELRWMAQALPSERPLPEAYGEACTREVRRLSLRYLAGAWLAVRWPVWITGTLVLERALGVRGLGSDWAERLACRDRAGILAWMGAMALAWTATRLGRRRCA